MDAGTHIGLRAALVVAVCVFAVWGCQDGPGGPQEPNRPASCPASRSVEPPLSNVSTEQETLEYWLARNEQYGALDEPLLGPDAIQRHDLALREPRDGEPIGQTDLLGAVDRDALRVQLDERLAYMRARLDKGELVRENGAPTTPRDSESFHASASVEAVDEWSVIEGLEALRCGPYDGSLYTTPVDPDFDRNRCSTMREGEVVHVLARWPNGMFLARTAYALGWVRADALGSAVERETIEAKFESRTVEPFTRRAVLSEAFSMLGEPYGWGGRAGGYDCSRFLLEVFGRFGID